MFQVTEMQFIYAAMIESDLHCASVKIFIRIIYNLK